MNIIDKLKLKENKIPNNKGIRFFLNVLSSTPYIGGIFSAFSGLLSEEEQDKINNNFIDKISDNDERLDVLEKECIINDTQSQIIAGFIKFNPNTMNIIKTSKISSLADKGTLNCQINFIIPIENYFFSFYGNSPLQILKAKESSTSLDVTFVSPCPEQVTIVFYKI